MALVRTTLEQRQDMASSRSMHPNFAAKIIYDSAGEKMYHTGATNGSGVSPELHGEARRRHYLELGLGQRARGRV